MFFEYYVYYLFYTFLGYPIIIRMAVFSVFVCLIFFVIAFIKILTFGRRYNQKEKLKKRIDDRYGEGIEKIMKAENKYSLSDINDELKSNVRTLKKKEKLAITNRLLKARDEIENHNPFNYKALIDYFELLDYWERQLKTTAVFPRQRALRKLEDLGLEAPGSVISTLLYHRDRYLRKRAHAAYMRFSKNDPYKFFDSDFDKTFNDWDRVEIHEALLLRQKEGLPSFIQWVENSKNVRFQCFLIDEIAFFNQQDGAPFLLNVAKKHVLDLRRHSIDCLGNLKYEEAEKPLIEDYMTQPRVIQKHIVSTTGKLNTGEALPFLELAYRNSHDTENGIVILRAIYNYGEKGRLLFNMLEQRADSDSRMMFQHVSNPLIKFY